MGIEPTFEAWEAPVLPLNYTREMVGDSKFTFFTIQQSPSLGRGMRMVRIEVKCIHPPVSSRIPQIWG